MSSSESKTSITAIKALASPILSQAVVHGGTVFVSGTLGLDPASGKMVEGSCADRTRQAIKNLETILKEAGSGLDKILKCNIYLTNMTDYAAMNNVYTELIPDPKPARTCVCVAGLPLRTDIEIECTAAL